METQKNNERMTTAEVNRLEAKVRECNTYKHGYFVLMTKVKKQGATWEKVDQLLMSQPQTEAACNADKYKYDQIISMYGRRAGMKTTISIHNIYERYDLWKAAKGEDIPRAAQWADIKAGAQA